MVPKNGRALIAAIVIKAPTLPKKQAGYICFLIEMKDLTLIWIIRPKCGCSECAVKIKLRKSNHFP